MTQVYNPANKRLGRDAKLQGLPLLSRSYAGKVFCQLFSLGIDHKQALVAAALGRNVFPAWCLLLLTRLWINY
jgi:hypothetical protein